MMLGVLNSVVSGLATASQMHSCFLGRLVYLRKCLWIIAVFLMIFFWGEKVGKKEKVERSQLMTSNRLSLHPWKTERI